MDKQRQQTELYGFFVAFHSGRFDVESINRYYYLLSIWMERETNGKQDSYYLISGTIHTLFLLIFPFSETSGGSIYADGRTQQNPFCLFYAFAHISVQRDCIAVLRCSQKKTGSRVYFIVLYFIKNICIFISICCIENSNSEWKKKHFFKVLRAIFLCWMFQWN